MPKPTVNITIKPNAELNIFIQSVTESTPPTATVITNTGEVVQQFTLSQGNNRVNITAYQYKNYAIRVTNGKNVTVQKI